MERVHILFTSQDSGHSGSRSSDNGWGKWEASPDKPSRNDGSFSDDYTSFEQGEFLSSSISKGILTTPLDSQGTDTSTDAYAGYAFCLSIVFAVLALCMFLQYNKRCKNTLLPKKHRKEDSYV